MLQTAGYGVVPIEQARAHGRAGPVQGPAGGPLSGAADLQGSGLPARRRSRLGRVVFGYTPVFDHYNPLGTVHGGIAATLLDSVMGCCIHTTLKAGTGYTTVEIKVNYVRAMTDKTGPVRAEGKIINVGSRIAHVGRPAHRRVRQASGARHHRPA